jgi:HrpA-like RNA helicase
MPGAPEIDRLVRQLQGSPKLAAAAAGASLRVLPLHGSLPAGAQARVFERAGRGVVKIVCATNGGCGRAGGKILGKFKRVGA